MKKGILIILLNIFSVTLSAQHTYVVFGRVDGLGYEKFFGCGERFKVKLKGGEKKIGVIDTVFADGMVLSGDSVLFSDVKKIGYRFQNKRFLKNYMLVSGIGMGLGAAFTILSIFESKSPEHPGGGETLGGAAAVFILSAGPFFLDALHKETSWQQRKVTKAYHLYGLLGN